MDARQWMGSRLMMKEYPPHEATCRRSKMHQHTGHENCISRCPGVVAQLCIIDGRQKLSSRKYVETMLPNLRYSPCTGMPKPQLMTMPVIRC